MVFPRHIPLTERKALCGRLLYLDALNQFGLAFLKDNKNTTYSNLQQFLFAFINSEVNKDRQQREAEKRSSGPPTPLRHLDTSLKEALNGFQGAPVQSQVNQTRRSRAFVNSLTTSVQGLSCRNCSSSPNVCDGVAQTKDDAFVSQKGDCIRQLYEMFELARDAAQAYYGAYTSAFPSSLSPKIIFSTQKTKAIGEEEHPLPKFHAGAVTRMDDSPSQAQAETKLCLVVDRKNEFDFKLDLYTYKGILYVMFHECIAHAWHGLRPTFTGRKSTRPFDEFAEGFMDHVAYMILEEVVNGAALANKNGLSQRVRFKDSAIIAQKMYVDRNIVDFEEIATNKAAHARGVQAAYTALSLMKKAYKSEEFGPVDDYASAFYRVALELNLRQDIGLAETNDFIALMNDYLLLSALNPSELERQENLVLLDTEGIFVDYLRNGDISMFIKSAQALSKR